MSWKKMPRLSCAAIMPPVAPTFTALFASTYSVPIPEMPSATQSAATHALFVHTTAANPAPGS
jgi:hypothetical protein